MNDTLDPKKMTRAALILTLNFGYSNLLAIKMADRNRVWCRINIMEAELAKRG